MPTIAVSRSKLLIENLSLICFLLSIFEDRRQEYPVVYFTGLFSIHHHKLAAQKGLCLLGYEVKVPVLSEYIELKSSAGF